MEFWIERLHVIIWKITNDVEFLVKLCLGPCSIYLMKVCSLLIKKGSQERGFSYWSINERDECPLEMVMYKGDEANLDDLRSALLNDTGWLVNLFFVP